jgi:hypothetical protein
VIYLLDFRGASTGGAVTPGVLVTRPGLGTMRDLRAEAQVTFLLHGFNVNRADGEAALLRLAAGLPTVAADGVVAVLWPGDHWARAVSYPFEGQDADDSAAALAVYIRLVVALRPGTRLQFVTHSLGARVAFETVKRLAPGTYRVGQVCLLAPALDDFSVANPAQYRDQAGRAERAAVLASRADLVLRLAYPAGDLLQRFIFFRKEQAGLALGYHGPRPHDASAVPVQVHHVQIPDDRGVGHGDYLPAAKPTPEQDSAIHFANQVLGREPRPKYPERPGT